ncbi:MAG: hypothetical protein SangKO_060890 [Sandaracinaceae bacterium]
MSRRPESLGGGGGAGPSSHAARSRRQAAAGVSAESFITIIVAQVPGSNPVLGIRAGDAALDGSEMHRKLQA